MAEITASMVRELRKRTGIGIMDCKKALIEASGDIKLAITNMRKYGVIQAAKKLDNVTTEGIIITKIYNNYGVILEVNCQTDFVSKEIEFQSFAKKALNIALNNKITDIKELKAQLEEERVIMIAKTGENINIRRLETLQGEVLGTYQHGLRIGVLVAAKKADKELIRKLAMHIAASKPEFINPEDVPIDVIKKEYQVQLDIAMQSGKPKKIIEKIVNGRMKKFTEEISLTGQSFIMDQNKSVAQLLKEHNSNVTGFIRFEVGEII